MQPSPNAASLSYPYQHYYRTPPLFTHFPNYVGRMILPVDPHTFIQNAQVRPSNPNHTGACFSLSQFIFAYVTFSKSNRFGHCQPYLFFQYSYHSTSRVRRKSPGSTTPPSIHVRCASRGGVIDTWNFCPVSKLPPARTYTAYCLDAIPQTFCHPADPVSDPSDANATPSVFEPYYKSLFAYDAPVSHSAFAFFILRMWHMRY